MEAKCLYLIAALLKLWSNFLSCFALTLQNPNLKQLSSLIQVIRLNLNTAKSTTATLGKKRENTEKVAGETLAKIQATKIE